MSVVKEEQNLTEHWIWCLLCACVGLCGWGVIRQIIVGVEAGQHSISLIYLVLLASIPCLALIYFYKNKLHTQYDQNGIKIKYFPFKSKIISWKEVSKIEIDQLNAFSSALLQSKEYDLLYQAESRAVLKLETKSEKLVISTTKPEEIQRLVDTYFYHQIA